MWPSQHHERSALKPHLAVVFLAEFLATCTNVAVLMPREADYQDVHNRYQSQPARMRE